MPVGIPVLILSFLVDAGPGGNPHAPAKTIAVRKFTTTHGNSLCCSLQPGLREVEDSLTALYTQTYVSRLERSRPDLDFLQEIWHSRR